MRARLGPARRRSADQFASPGCRRTSRPRSGGAARTRRHGRRPPCGTAPRGRAAPGGCRSARRPAACILAGQLGLALVCGKVAAGRPAAGRIRADCSDQLQPARRSAGRGRCGCAATGWRRTIRAHAPRTWRRRAPAEAMGRRRVVDERPGCSSSTKRMRSCISVSGAVRRSGRRAGSALRAGAPWRCRPSIAGAPASRRWAPRTACAAAASMLELAVQPRGQPRRQQRVAAEREEVVVDAEARQARAAFPSCASTGARARAAGAAALGARAACAAPAARGSDLRSTLPFGSSGSASSATTCCGIMYWGSGSRRCSRSAIVVERRAGRSAR